MEKARVCAGRKRNGISIVCITRLVYRKGVDLLVEVIPGAPPPPPGKGPRLSGYRTSWPPRPPPGYGTS